MHIPFFAKKRSTSALKKTKQKTFFKGGKVETGESCRGFSLSLFVSMPSGSVQNRKLKLAPRCLRRLGKEDLPAAYAFFLAFAVSSEVIATTFTRVEVRSQATVTPAVRHL